MEHRADVASCPGRAEVAPQLLIPSPNMAAPIWLRLRDLFPRFQTRNIDKSQRGPQSRQRWMEGKERGQEKKKKGARAGYRILDFCRLVHSSQAF